MCGVCADECSAVKMCVRGNNIWYAHTSYMYVSTPMATLPKRKLLQAHTRRGIHVLTVK